MPFQLESNYQPRGDQEQAIAKLLNEADSRYRCRVIPTGVTATEAFG